MTESHKDTGGPTVHNLKQVSIMYLLHWSVRLKLNLVSALKAGYETFVYCIATVATIERESRKYVLVFL